MGRKKNSRPSMRRCHYHLTKLPAASFVDSSPVTCFVFDRTEVTSRSGIIVKLLPFKSLVEQQAVTTLF